MSLRILIVALALASPFAALSSGAPTAQCNADTMSSGIYVESRPGAVDPRVVEALDAMERVIQDPASNPALYERMGRPISFRRSGQGNPGAALTYDLVQDPDEMRERFKADPQLMAPFINVHTNRRFWGYPLLPSNSQLVTEYHHGALDHYYMTADEAEKSWLDTGGGGGGWRRTGHAWETYVPLELGRTPDDHVPVFVFYGTPGVGPNSHFFTARADECGWLRNTQGWTYVALGFGVTQPKADGQCPAHAPLGLMRLYNNRWRENDSNHRFTSDPAVYARMQDAGWTGDGVQFCVKSWRPGN